MSLETRAGRDRDLAEKLDAVCRMGSLMLTSGTGSYRVKAAMGRVAAALGVEQLEAEVTLTEIVATTRSGKSFRTQVVEVPVPAVNAHRIAQLMRVSLRARPGLRADDLQRQLDLVEATRPLYATWAVLLATAVACLAFAFLNNGRWQECLAAGIGAAAGKAVQLALRHRRLNQLAIVAVAAFTACGVYLLAAEFAQFVFPNATAIHEVAFTSAMLFLVPGFPLLTAALDLARFDIISGLSRLTYATMITLAAAMGAWLIAWSFGLAPAESAPLALPVGALAALRFAASFAGVLGFAVTFNTPFRVALVAAGIGGVANLARLSAGDAGLNPLLCAAGATTLIGLIAGWAGQRVLSPRITLSVPAVLIMIPGATTYRALVAMIDRDTVAALSNGMASLAIVVALAAGLAIARMLTDPAWISTNPTWTSMPRTRAQQELRRNARGLSGPTSELPPAEGSPAPDSAQ